MFILLKPLLLENKKSKSVFGVMESVRNIKDFSLSSYRFRLLLCLVRYV